MSYLGVQDRFQIQMRSMEEFIDKENAVRFVDAFVEQLELPKLGFEIAALKTEGRPSFNPKVFLKLYFYGYLNGLRSSRKLEKEVIRNVELHWLLEGLAPNYHSISDFRKINAVALKTTFKLFVLFLKDANLVTGSVVAMDGTKIRANNSKKNNYNPKKIERHLAYIEEKTNEYLAELEQNDLNEKSIEKVKNIQEKIDKLSSNKIKYEQLTKAIEASGEPQVSSTDPDARALLVQGQVVEVSYNMQAAVDQKHNLVVATHTINRNDRNAMSDIALETKENLNLKSFTAILDKGYHNGREIETCQKAGITTLVCPPTIVNSNNKGTTSAYMVDKFEYNATSDTYTCPEGNILSTTGSWHKKSRERDSYQFKKYRTPACKTCSVQKLCTAKADGRREIDRSQYADAVEKNGLHYKANKDIYRKRQEINEHIFGTIKRQWGYNHTNLRGLEKVNGEMALIMTVYNMKRAMNILGIEKLLEKLKRWKPDYKKVTVFSQKRSILRLYNRFYISPIAQAA
jgi:transposase